MKYASNNELLNLEKKYEEVNVKFKEIQKIIELDGKHKLMYDKDQISIMTM